MNHWQNGRRGLNSRVSIKGLIELGQEANEIDVFVGEEASPKEDLREQGRAARLDLLRRANLQNFPRVREITHQMENDQLELFAQFAPHYYSSDDYPDRKARGVK
jgi:hypothetical protein